MNEYSAIIFDMDGVIVDSEPRHEQAFIEIFNELGYGSSHGMDFQAYFGRSDRALWLDFVAKHKPQQSMDQLIALKQGRFMEIIRREKPIFEELPALVDRLAARYRLAVASGSALAVIEEILAIGRLRDHFEVVVSVQAVPRGKPFPDVFLRTAELLKLPPAKCCVIEDTEAGVAAACDAGMDVIAITNTMPADRLSRARHVVDSFERIESLLL